MFKVIEKTKIWFSISLAIILVGIVLMATRGLNFGIDFKGGTKIVIDFGNNFDKVEVDGVVNTIYLKNVGMCHYATQEHRYCC